MTRALLGLVAGDRSPEWYRRMRLVRRAHALAREMAATDDPAAWCDVLEEFPEFPSFQRKNELVRLLRFVTAASPERVCEIGAAGGGTLCALTRAARANATIVSVDAEFTAARLAAFPKFARGSQAIVCVQGDSHEVKTRQRVRAALGSFPIDVLVIDGDHSYDGVARDFELYASLVRKGGIVAFHDIVPDVRQRTGADTTADSGGVPRFWAELRARYSGADEIIDHPAQDGCGLGVLPWPGLTSPG